MLNKVIIRHQKRQHKTLLQKNLNHLVGNNILLLYRVLVKYEALLHGNIPHLISRDVLICEIINLINLSKHCLLLKNITLNLVQFYGGVDVPNWQSIFLKGPKKINISIT